MTGQIVLHKVVSSTSLQNMTWTFSDDRHWLVISVAPVLFKKKAKWYIFNERGCAWYGWKRTWQTIHL